MRTGLAQPARTRLARGSPGGASSGSALDFTEDFCLGRRGNRFRRRFHHFQLTFIPRTARVGITIIGGDLLNCRLVSRREGHWVLPL
jgi:hypothetical protein